METILFIIPPNITFEDFVSPPHHVGTIEKENGNFGSVITDVPLGPISLSAYLKKYIEVEVYVIDFNIELNRCASFEFLSFSDYFNSILSSGPWAEIKPSIVGISAQFSPSYLSVIALTKCCRTLFPSAMILAGGNLPTSMCADIFRDSDCIDAVCYGEGEMPLLDMIRAEDKAAFMDKHSSWVTREKIARNEQFSHMFINDLDEIPFLDYDILDLEGYELNPTMARYSSGAQMGKGLAVMTSRGCPFKCIFCASHKTHGRDMRYYSTARVIEDIEKVKALYGVKSIILQDDHFMGDRGRAYDIVDGIRRAEMTIFFQNALALYALDHRFLTLLKQTGVEELVLAVESGSERVLKNVMKKPLKLDIIKRVVKDCREIGIYSDCNVIIGLPGETKQDIEETRAFLKTIFADWFRIFVATPLPGSEMYDICEDKNYFDKIAIEGNYKKAIVETEDFTAAYIQEMTYLMNIELNFVNNSNFRLGNYEKALHGFKNVINAASNHALAYYYAGLCLEQMGDSDAASEYFAQARQFGAGNQFWETIIEQFDIPLYETASKTAAMA